MVWTPDTSDTLVDTPDRLGKLLVDFTVHLAQQLDLLENLVRIEVSNADWPVVAIDEVANNDGVLLRPWRHGDFDLGVFCGEGWEMLPDELAVVGGEQFVRPNLKYTASSSL